MSEGELATYPTKDHRPMKAERRHELQTNDLADLISHGFEKHRQNLPTLLWGAVAVVAVIMALTLWSSRRGSVQEQAWEEFDHIRYTDGKVRPKRLKELIERYPNTEIALWMRLDLADQLSFDGREKMPLDRDLASTYLKEAQQNYASVLQDAGVRPDMIRRAALAEAKCWELLGDREKAIASYKKAAEKYKSLLPDIAETAARQATDLSQPEAADFYKWLAEYKAPSAPSLNLPGLGPNFPPLGNDRGKEPSFPAFPAAPGEPSKEGTKPDSEEEQKAPNTGTTPSESHAAPAASESPKTDEQPGDSAKPE
jgi:hypothetical protein